MSLQFQIIEFETFKGIYLTRPPRQAVASFSVSVCALLPRLRSRGHDAERLLLALPPSSLVACTWARSISAASLPVASLIRILAAPDAPSAPRRRGAAVVCACERRAARRWLSLWRTNRSPPSSSLLDGLASSLSGPLSARRANDALRALP